MLTNKNNYRFDLYVSQQGYNEKPSNKQVPQITFERRNLTIPDALQCATEGKAFCYSFRADRQDGIITIKDKTVDKFLSTSTIIYDFDDMEMRLMEFIEPLPFKPSFAYTTYSDGKNGFSRYRLAFVFEHEICGKAGFYTLYYAIASANGFVQETQKHGGWDVRAVNQLYYGTNSKATTYNGSRVYSASDFESFAVPYAEPSKSSSSQNCCDLQNKVPIDIDEEFLNDFNNLSHEELYVKYREVFQPNYFPSLETPLLLDESEMFYLYPDDYVCVRHKQKGKYTYKYDIGEDRKKKLFITAHIMRYNLPSISIENLIYNLSQERLWYYDNTDGKITNKVVIDCAIRAFTVPYPLAPSKHNAYRINKSYWEGKGYTGNQAKMIVRRYLKTKEVERLYNPSLTIKENVQLLNDSGIKISERTFKRMVSRGDIKIINQKGRGTYLSCRPNSDTIEILRLLHLNRYLSQSDIAKKTGKSLSTIKRLFRDMKGKMIIRDGDNRDGEWILLPPFNKYIEKEITNKRIIN